MVSQETLEKEVLDSAGVMSTSLDNLVKGYLESKGYEFGQAGDKSYKHEFIMVTNATIDTNCSTIELNRGEIRISDIELEVNTEDVEYAQSPLTKKEAVNKLADQLLMEDGEDYNSKDGTLLKGGIEKIMDYMLINY